MIIIIERPETFFAMRTPAVCRSYLRDVRRVPPPRPINGPDTLDMIFDFILKYRVMTMQAGVIDDA
jgi:hypothetical protein